MGYYYDDDKPIKRRIMHELADARREESKSWFERMTRCMVATHPYLSVDFTSRCVYLLRKRKGRVAILSGGQAGHEPMGPGLVSEGLLTGWVSGTLKSPPTWGAIYSSIEALSKINSGGTLVIAMNYFGNLYNFSKAVKMAQSTGNVVDMVVVGDDVSVIKAQVSGKRATVGVLFYYKLAGCLSCSGESVGSIAAQLKALDENVATVSAVLAGGSEPGSLPRYQVDPGTVHLGTGIEGEPGLPLPMMPLGQIIQVILTRLASYLNLQDGNSVVVIVNNLGTVTPVEMNMAAHETKRLLIEEGYNPVRIYCGAIMTSMDTNGFQISILNVSGRENWLRAMDSKVVAFAWPGTSASYVEEVSPVPTPVLMPQGTSLERIPNNSIPIESEDRELILKILDDIVNTFHTSEEDINVLDMEDGDAGTHLKQLGEAITKRVVPQLSGMKNLGELFNCLYEQARDYMGPLCGGIYSLLFLGFARNSYSWPAAVSGAISTLMKYTAALPEQDKTLIDSLAPAASTFLDQIKSQTIRSAYKSAVAKALEGCEATKYAVVSKSTPNTNNYDAGAYAVTLWLAIIHRRLSKVD